MDQESKIVTARGTEDGLVFRIDGKADWNAIIGDLDSFLGGRRRFFEGGEVSIEWLDRLPTAEQSAELLSRLSDSYGLSIVTSRRRRAVQLALAAEAGRRSSTNNNAVADKSISAAILAANSNIDDDTSSVQSAIDRAYSSSISNTGSFPRTGMGTGMEGSNLSDHIETEVFSDSYLSGGDYSVNQTLGSSLSGSSVRRAGKISKLLGEDLLYEDDPNSKVVFGTLRSGQRLETPFSLIIVGDVNPGADLVAGGDIIVLGNLRGTAHAAAYDDDSFDRVIIALQMQPMQLRIGSVISRGNGEAGRGIEIARIENRRIVVEAFNARGNLGKKLR